MMDASSPLEPLHVFAREYQADISLLAPDLVEEQQPSSEFKYVEILGL